MHGLIFGFEFWHMNVRGHGVKWLKLQTCMQSVTFSHPLKPFKILCNWQKCHSNFVLWSVVLNFLGYGMLSVFWCENFHGFVFKKNYFARWSSMHIVYKLLLTLIFNQYETILVNSETHEIQLVTRQTPTVSRK